MSGPPPLVVTAFHSLTLEGAEIVLLKLLRDSLSSLGTLVLVERGSGRHECEFTGYHVDLSARIEALAFNNQDLGISWQGIW
jgi:hypothetical protein